MSGDFEHVLAPGIPELRRRDSYKRKDADGFPKMFVRRTLIRLIDLKSNHKIDFDQIFLNFPKAGAPAKRRSRKSGLVFTQMNVSHV